MSSANLGTPGPFFPSQKPDIGNYQIPLTPGPLTSAQFSNVAALYVYPLPVMSVTSYDRLGFQLTTAQTAGALRGGIYGFNNGVVTAAPLVADLGALDLSTGSGTVVTATVTLQAGVYWFAAWLANVTTAVTGLSASSTGSGGVIAWDASLSIASVARSLHLPAAYPGSMPGTLPASIVSNSGPAPVPQLRVSA